jgi:hypothetical protein
MTPANVQSLSHRASGVPFATRWKIRDTMQPKLPPCSPCKKPATLARWVTQSVDPVSCLEKIGIFDLGGFLGY